MRMIRYVAMLVFVSIFVTVPHAAGLEAVAPEPLPPQSALVISAHAIDADGRPRYLEIYNNSNVPQKASDWSFTVQWAARPAATALTPALSFAMVDAAAGHDLYIPPDGYVVVSFDGAYTNAHIQVANVTVQDHNYVSRISLQHAAYRPYERTFTAATTQSPMRLNRGATGYTTAYVAEDRAQLWQTDWYSVAPVTALRIVEVYPNAVTCQPFDTAPTCSDYVKLYNPTDEVVDLADFRLRTGAAGQNATASNTAALTGGLAPGGYAVVPLTLTNGGSWVWLEDRYGALQYQSTVVSFPDSASHKGRAWSYDDLLPGWRWTSYPTPYDMANQFTDGRPVNPCSALRLSEIGANLPAQFVELYNSSSAPIDLRGCQLQTNRSQDARYVFGEQLLGAGELVTVWIAQSGLTLTKTTTGTVYVLSSDGQTEVDARSYENLSENTSYSLIDGVWRQTFAPTPGSYNRYMEYPACQSGYERNLETGRCNKIAIATVLTPCRDDQYRSPETNRCRNLTSATSTLTPCRENQYRSPETNRCRNIALTASTLKPCAAGQERNPATNRCRKIVSGDGTAGFKVVDAQAASDQVLSWLALGGVGLMSLGYAGWEWRREVFDAVAKAVGLLPFVK